MFHQPRVWQAPTVRRGMIRDPARQPAIRQSAFQAVELFVRSPDYPAASSPKRIRSSLINDQASSSILARRSLTSIPHLFSSCFQAGFTLRCRIVQATTQVVNEANAKNQRADDLIQFTGSSCEPASPGLSGPSGYILSDYIRTSRKIASYAVEILRLFPDREPL
ncbi:hypothetical protein DFH11DRAFT_1550567 [Phellopilus nigrolimitatus]|nr:hypothetical protein DFH11DRAFT_1550567 [Phellopilus nigrolimitatus]